MIAARDRGFAREENATRSGIDNREIRIPTHSIHHGSLGGIIAQSHAG